MLVEYADHVKEIEQYRTALQIIAADTEYPCEIMDLEGNDGPCQCTCCRWARLAREALSVRRQGQK
ncbi:MAG TPA: hypothetical protein ACFYD4_16710 [Candidatus Wunengus sp. YC61]|uniref:hypothetical protein n=1 Tax=Candidatus Wunengus sp. YC61 TaxID=3367698 RepID=UPI0040287271